MTQVHETLDERLEEARANHSYAIFLPQELASSLATHYNLQAEVKTIVTATLFCYSWKRSEFMWSTFSHPSEVLLLNEHMIYLTDTLTKTLRELSDQDNSFITLVVEQTLAEIHRYCQTSKSLDPKTVKHASKEIGNVLTESQLDSINAQIYHDLTHDLIWFNGFGFRQLHNTHTDIRLHSELSLKHIGALRFLMTLPNPAGTKSTLLKKKQLLDTIRTYSPHPHHDDESVMLDFVGEFILEMYGLPEALQDYDDCLFWQCRGEEIEERIKSSLSTGGANFYDKIRQQCIGGY